MKLRVGLLFPLVMLLGLAVQAGCGGAPDLPSEQVEPTEDPASTVETPPP